MKRLLSILPILLLVLISCERPITYHGEYDDPKLVVQAILYAGEDSIDCFVDRSYFFLDQKPNTKEPLPNVTVQIESASNPSLRLVRYVLWVLVIDYTSLNHCKRMILSV